MVFRLRVFDDQKKRIKKQRNATRSVHGNTPGDGTIAIENRGSERRRFSAADGEMAHDVFTGYDDRCVEWHVRIDVVNR